MSQFFVNTDFISDERFDLAKFMEFSVDNYDVLTSRFLNDLNHNISASGEFRVRVEENRSDILANSIYGSSQFWWIVLFFNSLLDTEEFEAGDILQFPSIPDLEDKFFNLKALEVSNNRSITPT